MLNFCVSLTTIPSRLKFIYKTLDSIKKQSKVPDKIFLNILSLLYAASLNFYFAIEHLNIVLCSLVNISCLIIKVYT